MSAPTGSPFVLRASSAGLVELPALCWVRGEDGQDEPVEIALRASEGNGGWHLGGETPSLSLSMHLGPGDAEPERLDGLLKVTNRSQAPVAISLRLAVRLGESPSPDWLIPGLFYGENRMADSTRRFPRFVRHGGDPAALESDHWSFRCDRAATPLVLAYDRHGGAGLATVETGPLGEHGLGLALVDGRAELRLHFPFREEPVTYYGTTCPLAPKVATALLAPGECADCAFWIYLLDSDRHGYDAIVRAKAAATRATRPADPAWVSLHAAAELAAFGLHRWHYRQAPAVLLETAAFDREALGERGDRKAMHVSWVSGTPYAYALLAHAWRTGSVPYREAALSVIDHCCANLTPGGTFYAQWMAEKGWTRGWTDEVGRLHARTLGDAVLFVLRALVLEARHGVAHPDWEAAVRSNLAAAVAHQRDDGAIGAAFHIDDGRVLDWRGCAGLAFVAPLAEASTAFSAPELAAAAARAGRYYASFVAREYLCGAPEDVDLAPTSEDGYVAVMAYVALCRVQGPSSWLALAQRAAEWTLSFRYTYDVAFEPTTLLGRYGFSSFGADQASPSNQHLHAFGLICHAELSELSQASGDPYYRQRAKDALSCFRQFIARADGDFNAYRGMASERFYQTTCFQAKGMLLTLSHAWSVGVLLLACEQELEDGSHRREEAR